jgi:hypothetical protein
MNSPTQGRQLPAIGPPGSEVNSATELGADIKAKIGLKLRSMYGEIIEQGVPDRFAEILRDLDDPTVGGRNER